jgi:hypothetical protein
MPASPRLAALSIALGGCCALCGCTLLKPIADVFGYWPSARTASSNTLPPLLPSRDALQIDLIFVERPVGDPLLGKSLWSQIDQVGAVSTTEAESLKRLGLRIGNAGESICPTLEQILRESEPADTPSSDTRISVKKETLCIGPGVSSPITTNSLAKCTIDVPTVSGTKQENFENFRSVLRLTAHHLQDEWARLEFVPEVDFGQERLRPATASAGLQSVWQPTMSQEVETLLAQRFSTKLHVGEMVAITADAPENPRLFGTRAFVREQPGNGQMQRVLLVRLSNMSRVDPVYAEAGPAISDRRR